MLCISSLSWPAERAVPLPALPILPRPEELVRLGRMLFEDKRLSADGTMSCAKCHVAKRAFTDGQPRAVGLKGQVGTRNTPSLLNIAYEKDLFWTEGSRGSKNKSAHRSSTP